MVAAEGELAIDAVLQGGETQLLQSARFRPGEGKVGQLDQGVALPEGEGSDEEPGGSLSVAGGHGGATVDDLLLERQRIDRAGWHLEDVALSAAHHPLRSEGLPELRHPLLQGIVRMLGQAVAPQLLEDPVVGNHPPGMHGEKGEESPFLGPRDGKYLLSLSDPDRAEEADAHGAFRSSAARRRATAYPKVPGCPSFSPVTPARRRRRR